MAKATEDKLNTLHGALAEELTDRIKNGETKLELVDCDGEVKEVEVKFPVAANTLSVARQFLKDNHIEAGPENKPLGDLVDSLPFDEKEEGNAQVN
jgi:hypothetical protein